jgi:hypothetical protein
MMITTRNTKFSEMLSERNPAWNEKMRISCEYNYNNSTNLLPEKFRGKSPHMVNTVLHLGWNEDDTLALLNFADATGDHPDWSEYDWDRLLFHFQQIEPLALDLEDA